MRGCGCCCCLLTAAVFVVVVAENQNAPQRSVVHLKRPGAICLVTSALCLVQMAVWGHCLYLCGYRTLSLTIQRCIGQLVSRIVTLQLVSHLPHPHHLTWPCPLLLSSHGQWRDGQRRPGEGQIVTGCSESGAGGGNQGAPPYYGTRPPPGGAA